MNGRLNNNWKKCQRWLAGGLLSLASLANPSVAQEPAIPSFLAPAVFPPPAAPSAPPAAAPSATPSGGVRLGAPEDKKPAPLAPAAAPAKLPPPQTHALAQEQTLPLQDSAVQPAVHQPTGDAGIMNALGMSNGKDNNVKQASCCGKGGGLFGSPSGIGPNGCPANHYGHGSKCVPGRFNCCSWCDSNTHCGRLLCGFYECLCCPDPCYTPHWVPTANAAFWVDPVRPVTMTRIRWDAGFNYLLPDRAEFFWARADGKGKGPKTVPGNLRYSDLSLYQEIAAKGASVFVEVPYRDLSPGAAGFSDMNVGFKSLFFDCELLQVAFQFRTFLPVGNFSKGLGTGHVSLEPSLLSSLKLGPDTYLQTQLAEFIPIGGDGDYAGAVMHYHASINHVLYRCLPDVPLIGTIEFNGYSYQDGAFTDPAAGTALNPTSGNTYMNAGPGLRLVICNKIDFGVSAVYSINQPGPQQLYRSEFRMRF